MGDETVGKLEQEAHKRREKLKALRKQREQGSGAAAAETEKNDLPLPELKLRNYQPISDKLQGAEVEKAEPGSVENHIKVIYCLEFVDAWHCTSETFCLLHESPTLLKPARMC